MTCNVNASSAAGEGCAMANVCTYKITTNGLSSCSGSHRHFDCTECILVLQRHVARHRCADALCKGAPASQRPLYACPLRRRPFPPCPCQRTLQPEVTSILVRVLRTLLRPIMHEQTSGREWQRARRNGAGDHLLPSTNVGPYGVSPGPFFPSRSA